MEIDLETVQELAPDQASLNAAQKLLKPAKWPVRGFSTEARAIWGQCQGSGSKPYFTMADPVDHGYKCTCPSRKFPCKHVLALLWQYSEAAQDFSETEHPEWVQEWLGRRRKGGTSSAAPGKKDDSPPAAKNIRRAGEPEPQLSAEEQQKRAEANARRAARNREATQKSVSVVLQEFSLWIDDQLRTGIIHLIQEITPRSRQLAARLVDGKAAALAARLDELPAKVLALQGEQQLDMVLKELGQMLLVCRAWQANPEDPDTRRDILGAENREQLLQDSAALRISGNWLVVGERSETRRDGLIAHTSWLLCLDQPDAPAAMLQDFYPVSAGRRTTSPAVGRQLQGEVCYYSSRAPLRALLGEFREVDTTDHVAWPDTAPAPLAEWHRSLTAVPWRELAGCQLGSGLICVDDAKTYWWQPQGGDLALPLANQSLPPLLLGTRLNGAFVSWNGLQAELLSASTSDWGHIPC
ncbi:SWIM zinc finger family protein [Microbulbifer aggregans]|uniref:SWIM zinc finger family protein n=1 Tax=Microbulbifer aggregans TaxID=1769779 RepID=UPI001CFE992E|nr:SWIM zinc finger family protein [Microbulbifer aggregans]